MPNSSQSYNLKAKVSLVEEGRWSIPKTPVRAPYIMILIEEIEIIGRNDEIIWAPVSGGEF